MIEDFSTFLTDNLEFSQFLADNQVINDLNPKGAPFQFADTQVLSNNFNPWSSVISIPKGDTNYSNNPFNFFGR